jgi:acyl-CoA reductase-like NAD-dependent aldehyde dehydrogenase
MTVMPFKEVDDQLIRRANDTVYGLAAGLWTGNIKTRASNRQSIARGRKSTGARV